MFANQLKLSSAVVYRAVCLLLAGSYTLALLSSRRNATIACQLKVVPPWSTAPQQGAHVTRDSGGGLFRRQTPYLSVLIRTYPYLSVIVCAHHRLVSTTVVRMGKIDRRVRRSTDLYGSVTEQAVTAQQPLVRCLQTFAWRLMPHYR